MTVTVNPNVTPLFNQVSPICSGATLNALPTISTNSIPGTWSPAVNNTATTTYTFTPAVGQCATTATMTITVNPNVTPTFVQVSPICSGETLAALPITSTNTVAISGTWSPVVNNTATTTYTFTPSIGQCATTAPMTIVVNANVVPSFTPVGPICSGAVVGSLPTADLAGITGTWTPAVINNTASTSYLFTPTAGLCATFATMGISVVPNVIPTFNTIAPICSGASLILPSISNNSITGTWFPLVDNTATTTYTFTPNAGQCAVNASMTVVVNPNATPTFTPLGPICSGTALSPLPPTDLTGIPGSWTPALNNVITTNYTFTPASGICATSQTLTITVNPIVTPTFSAVGPICAGATLAALPITSTNTVAISGTWSPAVNNTATTTYTFTPTAGQCATTAAMTITVNTPVTPDFVQVGPICSGGVLNLGLTSPNGVSGTWSPAVNNTATTTYTFTPTAGQCANVASMTITVTPNVPSTFTTTTTICSGAAYTLPLISDQGINGTWNPTFSNTTSGTYTFTPNAGQCGTVTTLSITVTPNVPTTFAAVGPICAGATVGSLQVPSNEGINGTWFPSSINNTVTTSYVFTPTPGVCALSATLTIVVNPIVTPTFDAVSPICFGDPVLALPLTSIEGITGTWNTPVNNTATTTYTFTPTAGQCAVSTSMTIVVNPIPSLSITPAVDDICSGQATIITVTTSPVGASVAWTVIESGTSGATAGSGNTINQTLSTTSQVDGTATYSIVPTLNGCTGSAVDLIVTVHPIIDASFTASNYCDGVGVAPVITGAIGGTFTFTPPVTDGATIDPSTGLISNGVLGTTYIIQYAVVAICPAATQQSVSFNAVPASPNTGNDTSYCSNAIFVSMTASSNNGGNLNWLDDAALTNNIGSGTNVVPANTIGVSTYYVTETVNGCQSLPVTVDVTVFDLPASLVLSSDTSYCYGDTLQKVFVTGTLGGIYNWYDDAALTNLIGSTDSILPNSVIGVTTYYATETSAQGCVSLPSSVSVTINDCYVLDVSTAFTPDGDGVNDSWLIAELNVRYPNNNVTIFNRWGQVLYNSDGYLIPWDGRFDNKDLPVGSYYYIIDFNDALDTPNATGIVTIIRN
jgi:gliding motility-associated-like protein